jgi:hypothetical protein
LRSIGPVGLIRGNFMSITGFARTTRFPNLGSQPDSGSRLEPAIDCFESVERVQELEAGVSHLIRLSSKLLRMLDGEPDAVNRDAPLVRHFELNRRGLGL